MTLTLNICCVTVNDINIHKTNMYTHHFAYLLLAIPDLEAFFDIQQVVVKFTKKLWLRKLIKKLMIIISEY